MWRSDSEQGGGQGRSDAKETHRLADGRRPEQLARAGQGRRRRSSTKKHPGVKVNHEYHSWPDKNAKLDAVLAGDKFPDVVEIGNTEMLGYMVKGAFAEIDPTKYDNSDAWLDGLKESVTYDGKTYGVPYYAGGRVAIWRKDIAAEVGRQGRPEDRTPS